MREFFRGWRRKVGCAMLVIACLLMVGWVRSIQVTDLFAIRLLGQLWAIESHNGEIGWQDFGSAPLIVYSNGWTSFDNRFRSPDPLAFNDLPYWSIVVPLALLSGWLLLSKPRPAKPAIQPEERDLSLETVNAH